MGWFLKHFLLKIVLAAFLIIFGVTLVKCLAWIVITLTVGTVVSFFMALNWLRRKFVGLFA